MTYNNNSLYSYLINKLLDIYEKKSAPDIKTIKSINLIFNSSNTPSYFLTDSSDYELYHIVCDQLKNEGIITIHWKNKIPGHIIDKITLNQDKVSILYQKTGRTPKIDIINNTLNEIIKYNGKNETLDNFIGYIVNRATNNKTVKQYIDFNNINDTRILLKGILTILNNKEEIYVRELSSLALKDSKLLELYESRICKIIKEFSTNEYDEQRSIYEAFNVQKTPRQVMFKGEVKLTLEDGSINVSLLSCGLGINSKDLDKITIIPSNNLKYIITVENLTTFYTFNKPNSLIIYTGGFNSSSTIKFIKRIKESIPNGEYYHWGDIDCGGLKIFKHLKENSKIDFKPLYMDKNTYETYKNTGKELTDTDTTTLNKMKEDDNFKEFTELINLMLLNNKKIEQESIVIQNYKI